MTVAHRKRLAGLAAISLLFIAMAMLFMRRTGIEADEAMIGSGIYARSAAWYSLDFGSVKIPLMLLSYLGALKTWIYAVIFHIWTPGPVSLRLPTVIVAAAGLWLFFYFALRITGSPMAAWLALLLLATDPSFLVITVSDFGFVTFQFVLKLAAVLLLLRFHEGRRTIFLWWGFFLFGVAMWDKAVFSWVLFGLGAAALVTVPKQLRRDLTWKNIGIAALASIAGALPLVIYNIAKPFETWRSTAKFSLDGMPLKIEILKRTLDGSVFFGFMTAAAPGPDPGRAQHWFQNLCIAIGERLGGPRDTLMLYGLAIALLAMPFVWKRGMLRPVLFALIACVLTWLPMAVTAGAGGAAHHVILLWPFPVLVVAIAMTTLPKRAGLALATLLIASNLAVVNEYYSELIRFGPNVRFTDAIYPLNAYLAEHKEGFIFDLDWGSFETLNLLSQGTTPVVAADVSNARAVLGIVSNPAYLFFGHTPVYTFQPELRKTVETVAADSGYTEEPVATIVDQQKRPMFEVFRFKKR